MNSDYRPTQNNIYAGKEIAEDGDGGFEVRGTVRSEASTASEQAFDNILNEDGQLYDHNSAPQIVQGFLGWFG